MGITEAAERVPLALAIADLACDLSLRFIVLDRLLRIPEIEMDDPEVAERVSLALAVANLARDHQRLLLVHEPPRSR